MTKQLPAYFEEYLDEKFNRVLGRLDSLVSEFKRMNGTLASVKVVANKNRIIGKDNSAKIKKVCEDVKNNRWYVFLAFVCIMVLGIVFLKESEFSVLKIISLIPGL